MADFCRQCVKEVFGEDDSDFQNIADDEFPIAHVLCEGCGQTIVDKHGTCVAYDCLKEHNLPES